MSEPFNVTTSELGSEFVLVDYFVDEWPCASCGKPLTVVMPSSREDKNVLCWPCVCEKTKPKKERNFLKLKYESLLKGIILSSELMTLKDVTKKDIKNANAVAKVIEVKIKDHNSEENIVKRGYKLTGNVEYAVLKVSDDSMDGAYITFDNAYTQSYKQKLLGLIDKTCLFKVKKTQTNTIIGIKVRELKT
jgi:hypothetical protein